jgi:NDP-sugar pyrophosphorylase family protein
MRAMILAAGLGTRLRPLTNTRPKALVEINGQALLEITLARLRTFGIYEVIINVHHFAEMVVEYLAAHNNFGMHIEMSREEVLLDTGGGLKKAAPFFLQGNAEDFVLYNVDVLSSIDLNRMLQTHRESGALATLAVQERPSSRQLLFDAGLQLCGRQSQAQEPEIVSSPATTQPLAFCGIHVISPRIFPLLIEEGVFPIIPAYLRLAAAGETIIGFRADEYPWRDLGTLENVRQAAQRLS